MARLLDLTVLAGALSPENRATAEDRGLEYVEGARARHCRVAVDGATFAASFPQVAWLVGAASAWRRGEASSTTGSSATAKWAWSRAPSTATAQDILPHGLLATVVVQDDRDRSRCPGLHLAAANLIEPR